jgi:hypothetical protein
MKHRLTIPVDISASTCRFGRLGSGSARAEVFCCWKHPHHATTPPHHSHNSHRPDLFHHTQTVTDITDLHPDRCNNIPELEQ